MKVHLTSTLRLLALLAVLSVLVTLPPATEASGGWICGSDFYFGPQSWGLGSTCDAAISDLQWNAQNGVYCDTGGNVCYQELVFTSDCFWNDMKGMYQIDGYIRYLCEYCGFLGGEACL